VYLQFIEMAKKIKTVNLKTFKRQVGQKRKVLTTFLRGIHNRKVSRLNQRVKELDQQAFQEIDCLDCGNCCKQMTPTYTKKDIKRISSHFKMTEKEYFDKYLYKDESGDIMHQSTPCYFLQRDNKCSIYEIRPDDCRGFPHLHKSDFKNASTINIQNIDYCPITFKVVSALYDQIVNKK